MADPVYLFLEINGAPVSAQAGQTIATSVTDSLGNFLFHGLKGGRYQIEAEGQKLNCSKTAVCKKI